jgi:hypothetical protein
MANSLNKVQAVRKVLLEQTQLYILAVCTQFSKLSVSSTFCTKKFEQFFQQLAILNDERSRVPNSKEGLAGTNTIRFLAVCTKLQKTSVRRILFTKKFEQFFSIASNPK